MSMKDRYHKTTAPWIPSEPTFNEMAIRNQEPNLLQMMAPPPKKAEKPSVQKHTSLQFDEAHFNQFEQEHEIQDKRKRQNPLGDFTFIKINEIF